MKTSFPRLLPPHAFLAALLRVCVFLTPFALAAQPAAPFGAIAGRIYNPVTKEYVRHAELHVEGTAAAAVSEDGGHFRLVRVPAGTAIVVVSYSGYTPARHSVTVEPGGTVARDFDLGAPADASSAAGASGVVQLTTFLVSSEREGHAKSVMNQRNSMDLGTSVASDLFGDVTEGNVGEFLKYLPGIEMEYVEADSVSPRLGGMDPQYSGVSVDGMKAASADAYSHFGSTENGSTGSADRGFSFSQISINSIESIEISRITPADLDADAPAGTINLKSKRAFDRKGRLFRWSLGTGLNSEEFTLRRTAGPGDSPTRKARPTYSLNYSESFLDNRLGILIGLSESNLYNEQNRADHTYNLVPTSADPRPAVLTSIQLKDGPKWTKRETANLTLDYKATPRLILSLGLNLNRFESDSYNHTVTLNAAAAANRTQVAGDGVLTFGTTDSPPANRSVALGGTSLNRRTHGITLSPRFEYKWGPLVVEGNFSYSRSRNNWGSLFTNGNAGLASVNGIQAISFTAVRPHPGSSAWTIVQTGGPDWSDVSNYKNPRIANDVRYAYNEVNNAELKARWTLPLRIPTFLHFGGKVQERISRYDRFGGYQNYNYIGPGGGTTGSYAAFPSATPFAPSGLDIRLTSVSGPGGPVSPDREAVGRLFHAHPEYFTNPITADNYFAAEFQDRQRFVETIPSAHVLANARFGRLTLQPGIRWERTLTSSIEFDPLPVSEVASAGFPVNTGTGRATTIPGLDYQYRSRPQVDRRGRYDNLFPSATAKYRFTESLIADVGVGHSIHRQNLSALSGLYSYDEANERIRASNPNLKPEEARKLAASIAYYFGGTSNLSLTLTQTDIENLRTDTEYSASEFGISDPLFADWTVITSTSGEGSRRFRSMEVSYRHQLRFLPPLLKGTTVYTAYTRSYASERRRGLTPHTVSGGLDWRYRRVGFGLRAIWVDDAPWSNATRYRRHNVKFDGNFDIRLGQKLTAFVQARNMLNESHKVYEASGLLWRAENYGGNWVFGIRGEF